MWLGNENVKTAASPYSLPLPNQRGKTGTFSVGLQDTIGGNQASHGFTPFDIYIKAPIIINSFRWSCMCWKAATNYDVPVWMDFTVDDNAAFLSQPFDLPGWPVAPWLPFNPSRIIYWCFNPAEKSLRFEHGIYLNVGTATVDAAALSGPTGGFVLNDVVAAQFMIEYTLANY